MNLFGAGLEQRRQGRPHRRHQALDRRHLGHLAEVGPPAVVSGMAIDRVGERARDLHQARLVVDPQPEAAQILGESRAARRERDLRQKPEGVEKRRIAGGNLKALLGCIRSRRRNALDVCVNLQKVDDLSPFFGLRERTETNVTHGACVAI